MITALRWLAYVVLAIVAGLALEASRLPFWQFMLGCAALVAGIKVCPLAAPRRKRDLSAEMRAMYEAQASGAVVWQGVVYGCAAKRLQRAIEDVPRRRAEEQAREVERRAAEAFERALIANRRRFAWKS